MAALCLMMTACAGNTAAPAETEAAAAETTALETEAVTEAAETEAAAETTAAAAETEAAETTAAPAAETEEETAAAEETGTAVQESAEASDKVAGAGETVEAEDIVDENAVPVTAADLKDGVYEVEPASSSSMFNIESAELHVENGSMYAVMTMGGTGYLYIYPGTAEEAAAAPESDYIAHEETAEGKHTFTIPVESLNTGIDCAAYSKRKEKWYNRTIVFRADQIPADAFSESFFTTAETLGLEDGTYLAGVVLAGGSGKASVTSPCEFTVENGTAIARIEFSSPNYDYVIKDGEKYLPVNTEGNSVFEIPLTAFDYPVAITADTTAMSQPHEIEYTLTFDSSSITKAEEDAAAAASSGIVELKYAHEFQAVRKEDGSCEITIGDDNFHIDHPYSNIYLASSAAMDLFLKVGAIDAVTMTGTKASDWAIEDIRKLVEDETITYAGKYSAPDYEYLVSEGCDLALENTMIYHTPEVKEKLESLGIPVMVERSSYETEPLGRMEWIKLYGILTGHYEEAAAFFEEKTKELEALADLDNTGKTVVFFYINSNGQPVVRKPGDYISKMIDMAGGTYFLTDAGGDDNMLSTMNMQMEAFLAAAADADILIYNSTIDAELHDLDELLAKDALFAGFKAVKEGNVWCTGKNMFQETSAIADMILEMHAIINGTAGNGENLEYIHKLN